MSLWSRSVFYPPAIAAAICVSLAAPVLAQDEEPVQEVDAAAEGPEIEDIEELEVIEEIIVVSPRPGARRRIEIDYEDLERERIIKEFHRMKELEEEYEWRASASRDDSSRIKMGYDPRDEYRMRNDTALQELSFERQKPATVFRVDF